jgi:predicted anti-sigma-YlaC factor YlaD
MNQQMMDCSEARLSLGVYVLGAIDPAERALVDAHLGTCRDCRDELAGLAGLPALLARVSAEEAMALAESDGPLAEEEQTQEPPRELVATVLDLTAARRRRRRWQEVGLSVAAALVIAAGVFGGLRLSSGPAPSAQSGLAVGAPAGPWETVHGQAQDMTATVSYRPMGWGTQVAAKVTGIPVGTTCQMWVVEPNGSRMLVASWVTDNNEGTVWYPSSAAVSAQKVKSFVITVGKTRAITIAADTD